MDGRWCPPAGGVDEHESVSACAVRECLEEVGVQIHSDSLQLLHTLHRRTPERYVIDLFFSADFSGEPYNAEPHKATDIQWVDPSASWPWMDYIPAVLLKIDQGVAYSECGFDN